MGVLGSYVWSARAWPAHLDGLWGEIPEAVIPLYAACMLPAAIGYVVTVGFLVLRTEVLDEVSGWFAAFLGAAALRLPMSMAALAAGDRRLVPWIQVDLVVTAAASLALLGVLLRQPGSTGRRYALIGWACLCWQTVVLDALVWPRFLVV